MRKVTWSAMVLGLFTVSAASAQSQHTPRGTAVDISKADVQATLQKTASAAVSDQAKIGRAHV